MKNLNTIMLFLSLTGGTLLFGAVGNASNLKDKIEYCKDCHGQNGEGYDLAVYPIPRLGGQTSQYLIDQLRYFTDRTRNTPGSKDIMWNAMTGIDLPMRMALASYFSTLETPARGSSGHTGNETIGKQIFEQGIPSAGVVACNTCHGKHGEGDGPMPRVAGLGYFYIKKMFEDWRNGYWTTTAPMPGDAKALTDVQIEALAEYLSSLP